MKGNLLPLALVAVFAVSVGVGGQQAYRQLTELRAHAAAAEAHLRQAQSQLQGAQPGKNAPRLESLRSSLAGARDELRLIDRRIDSLAPFYAIAEAIPWVGNQARAARKLARAASHVGEAAYDSLSVFELLVPANEGADGAKVRQVAISAAPSAAARLSSALTLVERAQEEIKDLSEDGLHPGLAKPLTEIKTQLTTFRGLLRSGKDALKILPQALGQDGEQTYLILVQDAGELRPTGGFIGNYGIVRFRDGAMTEVAFNDAYLVDWPYYYSGKALPTVGMFARYFPEATFWGLRDANIWPDFDRSAKQAAWFAVAEGVADRVDGVIGIDSHVVQPLMKVVGPITITEYGETVDHANVLERIRYYQTNFPGWQIYERVGGRLEGNRKLFTSLVLKAIMERLNGLDGLGLLNMGLSLQESFTSKAVQVYFDRPELQALVESHGLAGEMKSATGDYLWVVDMNLSAAKDNLYVKPRISYTASISATGETVSELEIVYDYYTRKGPLFMGTIKRGYYANYLRVYVPPGSELLAEYGTDEPLDTFHEMGKTVFGNLVKVYPGNLRNVKLRYRQPLKLWTEQGKTRYELIVQKQAGNDVESFEATISLPPGSLVVDPGDFKGTGNTLTYQGPLSSDLRLSATFTVP
ncbi:MAG: DUF4012 domain-containing protein [Chloroflexi bacterium]|nr:DUF4012 domain-containing protein [Chloroflexota bacterium]